jgi:lysozyme
VYVVAAIAAALLLASRRSYAVQLSPIDAAEVDTSVSGDIFDILGVGLPVFDQGGVMDLPSQNVAAFLYMIRRAEHDAAKVATGTDYTEFYGGTQFSDLSDHPLNTGEKVGVPLKPEQCRALGYMSGVCVSTAAGAYQIIRPTWDRIRKLNPPLPDFSPASQDAAAIRLLNEKGLLRIVDAGDVQTAIAGASSLWASLPGSNAGQNPRSLDEVLAFYVQAGGVA